MTTHMLNVEDVSVHFSGLQALDEVSLTVDGGAIHGFVGPNGAGKTTLINAITGYVPFEGQVRIGGREPSTRSPTDNARSGVNRTFQHVHLFPHLSVLENILVGRHQYQTPSWWRSLGWFGRSLRAHQEETTAAQRIVRLLRLEAVRDTSVRRLPFGGQKLVGIGRALATDPSLLFLDEPFGGLAGEEKELVARALLEIRSDALTIVMVEHDMRVISDLCDRVTVFDQGRVVVSDVPDAALRDERVIAAYLGDGETRPTALSTKESGDA